MSLKTHQNKPKLNLSLKSLNDSFDNFLTSSQRSYDKKKCGISIKLDNSSYFNNVLLPKSFVDKVRKDMLSPPKCFIKKNSNKRFSNLSQGYSESTISTINFYPVDLMRIQTKEHVDKHMPPKSAKQQKRISSTSNRSTDDDISDYELKGIKLFVSEYIEIKSVIELYRHSFNPAIKVFILSIPSETVYKLLHYLDTFKQKLIKTNWNSFKLLAFDNSIDIMNTLLKHKQYKKELSETLDDEDNNPGSNEIMEIVDGNEFIEPENENSAESIKKNEMEDFIDEFPEGFICSDSEVTNESLIWERMVKNYNPSGKDMLLKTVTKDEFIESVDGESNKFCSKNNNDGLTDYFIDGFVDAESGMTDNTLTGERNIRVSVTKTDVETEKIIKENEVYKIVLANLIKHVKQMKVEVLANINNISNVSTDIRKEIDDFFKLVT